MWRGFTVKMNTGFLGFNTSYWHFIVGNLIFNQITYYKVTKRVLTMQLHFNIGNNYLFLDWKDKQGRQFMYSVMFKCVHATTVAVEKQYIFWVWICNLIYPACNSHAPCCHLCPVRAYCTVLYCTVLYCTVLYCTVLYCTFHIIS